MSEPYLLDKPYAAKQEHLKLLARREAFEAKCVLEVTARIGLTCSLAL
jgi:hypothetical protein